MPRPGDVEFGPMNDLAEMARIASSYTSRLSPEQVRLSRIGRFIWLRFDVGSKLGSKGTSSQFAMARSGAHEVALDHDQPEISARRRVGSSSVFCASVPRSPRGFTDPLALKSVCENSAVPQESES